MEHFGMEIGALFDGDWESLSKYLTFDEPNLGADQFFSHSASLPANPSIEDGRFSYDLPNNHNSFSQDTTTSSYDFPLNIQNYDNSQHECTNLTMSNDVFCPTNFLSMDGVNDTLFASVYGQEDGSSNSQTSSAENQSTIDTQSVPERVFHPFEMEAEIVEKDDESIAMPPKKKARASKAKGKKTVQIEEGKRETTKRSDEDDMITNAGSTSHRTSGEISNSGSNSSQENSEEENSGSKELEIVATKGKKRASRGTATDPQSLYARRRREKINERLRILQNLVPNGTKVDISTMLEEAVHYVKFMQHQISLLSSDDLWMYAPLAYNGVDISLYRRISPFLLP